MRVIEVLCVMLWCHCTLTLARQPCKPPPLTNGLLQVSSTGGKLEASGAFSYNSTGKVLHFKDVEAYLKKASYIDVFVFFDEGVYYEIDTITHGCKKKTLHSRENPMELSSTATYLVEMNLGSLSVQDQGLKLSIWSEHIPDLEGNYIVCTSSSGCLTVSVSYFGKKKDLIFSFLNLETEVKDPQFFVLPSTCDGAPLEDSEEKKSLFGLFL